MVSVPYVTLMGDEVILDGLTADHHDLLKELYKSFLVDGMKYSDFFNLVHSQASLERMGARFSGNSFWLSSSVINSPAYVILDDLVKRLGVAQGVIKTVESANLDFSSNKKALTAFFG